MADLISRLEAAREGSRELDGDIAEALGIYRIERGAEGTWATPVDAPVARFECDAEIHWVWSSECPHYTTSVDDAMTLLPEGMSADLHIGPRGMANDAIVYERKHSIDEQGRRVTTFHPHEARAAREGKIHWNTPALAFCIACLRARASVSREH